MSRWVGTVRACSQEENVSICLICKTGWRAITHRYTYDFNQVRVEKILVDEIQPEQKYEEPAEEDGWIVDERKRNGQPERNYDEWIHCQTQNARVPNWGSKQMEVGSLLHQSRVDASAVVLRVLWIGSDCEIEQRSSQQMAPCSSTKGVCTGDI